MTNKSNSPKIGLVIGLIGLAAGIFLLIEGNTLIGIFGSIASAGIGIKAYSDLKKNTE